jgi:hypothetical protein
MNPFDIRTVVFAQWTRNRTLAAAACFNLLLAEVSAVPVVATSFAAWQCGA